VGTHTLQPEVLDVVSRPPGPHRFGALVAPWGEPALKPQTYDIPALRRSAFDPSVHGGPAPPVLETAAVPAVV